MRSVAARLSRASLTWKGASAARRAASSAWPMETHPSLASTEGPLLATRGASTAGAPRVGGEPVGALAGGPRAVQDGGRPAGRGGDPLGGGEHPRVRLVAGRGR